LSPSKKSFVQKNITHMATYEEEVPWVHKSISFFLPSFFLSFCYDIVLDGIRSFNAQVDQRIEEALCLSLCSYTGCLFFQEKLHIRRRSSRLSCKFPRSLPTPKSITAKMWCRTHSGSTTILLCRLPPINFLNLSLFPLQWIDLKRTSLCI
jgi:hypothetical protein